MGEWSLAAGVRPAVSGPVVTIVMDGVGIGPLDEGNAVHLAQTPTLDGLWARYGCLKLAAHGTAVGLPGDSDLGNSEVGHNALGAGRVLEQGASLVNTAISTGSLYEGETWRWLLDGVRDSSGTLHLIGLLSDGNVHSHEAHLHALLRRAAQESVSRIRLHVLLDGRDVEERSALVYVDRLEAVLESLRSPERDYQIASGGGRMVITMDRYEAEWTMVERGWAHHVHGEGERYTSARQAVQSLYETSGKTDQYLPPFIIADADGPVGTIHDGDSVVFLNFRGDRSIEISQAFESEDFSAFDRGRRPRVRYAGMMQYDGDLGIPRRFLVDPPTIERTMGEYLAHHGVPQFACSETQKFGHVTYFWNGNRSGYFDESSESYLEVPSDVIPFEERPDMKASEIVDATIDALRGDSRCVARINLANGDMVGHTGVHAAAIKAVESVDANLGRLLTVVERVGGVALVTADHGNCEAMYERDKKTGLFARRDDGSLKPKTSHTTNPVPFSLFDPHGHVKGGLGSSVSAPSLANVAATMLELLGYAAPEDYEPSLLS